MIDLRLLELAVALDQHRRFGRAAEAVGVTQPTFSRGIAALEASLGARLFDRSTRRVEPTPAGRILLARARPLLAAAAGLRGALDDHEGLRSGRVAVGVGPYPLDISVVECIARLSARHPLLQLEIIEGQWRDFGPKLLSGEVELAVVEASLVAADARFLVARLPVHAGCFYCRRGHPLDGRANLTVAELLGYPLVGVRLPVRALALPRLEQRLVSLDPLTGDVLPRITTTSAAASRAIVKRTDGIGIAVHVQLADDVRQGTLAILDADARSLRTGYGIAHLRDATLSPGAQAFAATLQEVEAELAAAATAAREPPRSTGLRRRRR